MEILWMAINTCLSKICIIYEHAHAMWFGIVWIANLWDWFLRASIWCMNFIWDMWCMSHMFNAHCVYVMPISCDCVCASAWKGKIGHGGALHGTRTKNCLWVARLFLGVIWADIQIKGVIRVDAVGAACNVHWECGDDHCECGQLRMEWELVNFVKWLESCAMHGLDANDMDLNYTAYVHRIVNELNLKMWIFWLWLNGSLYSYTYLCVWYIYLFVLVWINRGQHCGRPKMFGWVLDACWMKKWSVHVWITHWFVISLFYHSYMLKCWLGLS